MTQLIKRNLMVFFKDKSAVFFSLLSVFIIIALYALFLGDVWSQSLQNIQNSRFIMDSWISAGLLSVTSVTATMGAFGIMIEDKTNKIFKDFYVAPVNRRALAAGYVISSSLIGIIMCIAALVLCELYIVAGGGKILGFLSILKVLGLIVLSTVSNTAMIYFLVSFFKSSNAFSTASTIIGTLIGFLTGIYLPIGQLPKAVQVIVKAFPPSYSASLFRSIFMEAPLQEGFAGAPVSYLEDFSKLMGVQFYYGDVAVPAYAAIIIVVACAAVFYLLSVLSVSKKVK